MKPFDIELAKKGEKVITRCGFEALLCGEDNIPRGSSLCSVYPLAFYLYNKYNNLLTCGTFTTSGKFYDKGDSDLDLFMAEDSDFQPKNERIYYRGNMRRGDEIIADLEKRGGENVAFYGASNSDNIYFINQFGLIDFASYDDVKDSLNKFTELHIPPKKVKKEGWGVMCKSEISNEYYMFETIYSSESEAKKVAERWNKRLKSIKIIKIKWEEESK